MLRNDDTYKTPERIADETVKAWQERGDMPGYAFDFRGLIADGIRRAYHGKAPGQTAPCDSITDAEIDAIAEGMPGGIDGFLRGWGWRQFARAVLEYAALPGQASAAPKAESVPAAQGDALAQRLALRDDFLALLEGPTCPECNGTGVDGDVGNDGRIIDVTCGSCDGTGRSAQAQRGGA